MHKWPIDILAFLLFASSVLYANLSTVRNINEWLLAELLALSSLAVMLIHSRQKELTLKNGVGSCLRLTFDIIVFLATLAWAIILGIALQAM